MRTIRKLWRALYSKVKAQVVGWLAGGGLTVLVLELLDASGTEVPAELRAALPFLLASLSGFALSVLTHERHPAGPMQRPAPTPGIGGREGA